MDKFLNQIFFFNIDKLFLSTSYRSHSQNRRTYSNSMLMITLFCTIFIGIRTANAESQEKEYTHENFYASLEMNAFNYESINKYSNGLFNFPVGLNTLNLNEKRSSIDDGNKVTREFGANITYAIIGTVTNPAIFKNNYLLLGLGFKELIDFGIFEYGPSLDVGEKIVTQINSNQTVQILPIKFITPGFILKTNLNKNFKLDLYGNIGGSIDSTDKRAVGEFGAGLTYFKNDLEIYTKYKHTNSYSNITNDRANALSIGIGVTF